MQTQIRRWLAPAAFIGVVATAGLFGATTAGVSEAAVEATGQPHAQAETFAIDGVHSAVIFRIRHVGVAPFYGRFNTIGGTFVRDDAEPANNRFDITVQTESVDTANASRDRHLKSPDFFNAREHPEISFKSTKVTRNDDGSLDVTGDLSLHGVTKPVTAKLEWIGKGETPQGYKTGADVRLTIKRSDFGMTKYLEGGLGDEVTLMIGLEGKRN